MKYTKKEIETLVSLIKNNSCFGTDCIDCPLRRNGKCTRFGSGLKTKAKLTLLEAISKNE